MRWIHTQFYMYPVNHCPEEAIGQAEMFDFLYEVRKHVLVAHWTISWAQRNFCNLIDEIKEKRIRSNGVRECNQIIFISFAVLFLKRKLLKSLVCISNGALVQRKHLWSRYTLIKIINFLLLWGHNMPTSNARSALKMRIFA